MKKNNIEKLILSKNTDWVFNKQVAMVFDKHVRHSIPCYDNIQELISIISIDYLSDGSVVFDLGTGTGEVIYRIYQKNEKKSIKYEGIDNAFPMLEIAKEKCRKINNVTLTCENLENFHFKSESDFIVSSFTLQFIDPIHRVTILKKIKKSLTQSGVFILCEKIISDDEAIDKKFSRWYEYWKSKYFTQTEIWNKKQSLKNVMIPINIEQNINQLYEAGFDRVHIFYKWCNFLGIIAY